MTGRHALASCFLAAALLAGVPDRASAQCRLCPAPTTERPKKDDGGPIRLEIEANLDFDRLVLFGAGAGAATLFPSGERSATGSVTTLSGRAMVGSVTIHGEPGRAVRVELPARAHLYSLNGARIVIEEMETDLPSLPKLDPAGRLSFRFGGRLTISGDAEGEYRGDVPITVDYL